jgi:hypothetical protein
LKSTTKYDDPMAAQFLRLLGWDADAIIKCAVATQRRNNQKQNLRRPGAEVQATARISELLMLFASKQITRATVDEDDEEKVEVDTTVAMCTGDQLEATVHQFDMFRTELTSADAAGHGDMSKWSLETLKMPTLHERLQSSFGEFR